MAFARTVLEEGRGHVYERWDPSIVTESVSHATELLRAAQFGAENQPVAAILVQNELWQISRLALAAVIYCRLPGPGALKTTVSAAAKRTFTIDDDDERRSAED